MSPSSGVGEASGPEALIAAQPTASQPQMPKNESLGPQPDTPRIALVGPPNAGKSTLFNSLTGLRQRVANFPGVTVERRAGIATVGSRTTEIVDLPGLYSLSPRSQDQAIARDVLLGKLEEEGQPDAVILVLDATRLESHLIIAQPVLGLGLPTLVVLTMADDLDGRGGAVNVPALSDELGVEVAAVDARNPTTLAPVRRFLKALHTGGREVRACPLAEVAEGSERRTKGRPLPIVDLFAARRRFAQSLGKSADFKAPAPSRVTQRLDAVFLNHFWGPVVFVAVMVAVFQAIFTWAVPLMDLTELAIATSGEAIAAALPESWFRSLLVDGVWGGVGSVVVFLPQILILFFFISILEDSGYMARAAVITDRLLHRVGLQGGAFLPLLSAYACAVPALMAARTVEGDRDRLATMFVTPFMTCSARLPVYALLIAAFVPAQPLFGPFLGSRAAVLLGLYLLGLVAAVGTAALLKGTLLRGRAPAFVLDLPPYRRPTVRAIATRLLDRTRIFLRRAGRVILTAAVVLWVLTQFPQTPAGDPPEIGDSALGTVGQVIEPAIEPLGFDWRIGIGLVASLAAREVMVGALGTIYGVEDGEDAPLELQAALQQGMDVGGAVALLIFFVFALQCVSTVAVMRRETGGWRWPALQFGYMLALAYAGAWTANALL